MLLKRYIAAFSAVSVMLSAVSVNAFAEDGKKMTDSGINYTESTETINNPAAGYTKTIWARCKPNETPVYDPTAPLVLFFVDIGGFSSGNNGVRDDDGNYTPGKDYDLDEAFFKAWSETLENCHRNGTMVAFRFRYDAVGNDNPEPETFEQVLKHIEQIRESDLLTLYKEDIAFVETGFVGKWGEQHGGKYTSLDCKAKLLEAMLRAVPSSIPVTVRTPDTVAKWAGIERSQLGDRELLESLTESEYSTTIQQDLPRIGMYDDGYMGSDSDLGTYANRAVETEWLGKQTETSYFGGEFSGNIESAKKYDTYLPENAIPEMYKTHLSYINENIFQLYKDYTFGEECDVDGVDNSAYYGQNVYKFIRDHIGYRFVLRKSMLTKEVGQGGDVNVHIEVENTGFASVIPYTLSYIVLEKDGIYLTAPAEVRCNDWSSCSLSGENIMFTIPDNLPVGDWNVGLKLAVNWQNNPFNMNAGSIHFANEDVWMPSVGANYLGTVTVSESQKNGTNNSLFTPMNEESTPNTYFSTREKTVADGVETSPYEWTDDMLVGENENGEKLYIKGDERYLYAMGKMPLNGATAPVYNIQLKNNGVSYWMYFASNGFIYFNHEPYKDSMCRWSEDMVEFRIPFEVLGMNPNDEITDLRIFMQDSGADWKLMSDVRAPKVTAPSDLCVMTANTPVRLKEGENFSYNVVVKVPEETFFVWKHDGEVIEGFDYLDIELENIKTSDAGKYTVTVTTENGIVREISAFELEVVSEKSQLNGDANLDGLVTIADAAAILQYLGNKDRYSLDSQGIKNAEFDGEAGITTKDAVAIQKYVASNK